MSLIGASEIVSQQVVDHCRKSSVLVAANLNYPGKVVLSGEITAIWFAVAYAADERKLRVAKMTVAGAFHYPLILWWRWVPAVTGGYSSMAHATRDLGGETGTKEDLLVTWSRRAGDVIQQAGKSYHFVYEEATLLRLCKGDDSLADKGMARSILYIVARSCSLVLGIIMLLSNMESRDMTWWAGCEVADV